MNKQRLLELAGVQLNEYYMYDTTPKFARAIVDQIRDNDGDPVEVLAEILKELNDEVRHLLTTGANTR